TTLQNHFSISALEVSPSMKGTLGVLENVYAKRPLVGSGPNTFAEQWFLYRPPETLSSIFWNTEFTTGYSYVATAATTGGAVVALGWLFLLCVFLYTAYRALLSAPGRASQAYTLPIATAFASAFLFAVHLFYNPSESLTLVLFLFLGLFMASLPPDVSRPRSIVFSESPRLGFAATVLMAIGMVLSLVSVYGAGVTYAASTTEARALQKSNAGDISGALQLAKDAVSLSPEDRYLRTVTSLQLVALNSIVGSGKNDAASQAAFQSGLSQAVQSALAATAADPLSFDNWMSRASVYEAVIPLNIAGASDNAVSALEKARALNPATPEVDYQEATIKAFLKDPAGAKSAALSALSKKADYTPAILLLAQISLGEGNLTDAITALKSAIVLTPNDSSLFYELGLLELQAKEYQSASDAFGQAILITPDYANAKFFLGEADVFLGKNQDALALFTDLQKSNPGNAMLADIITKLQAGANPFASGTPLPPETPPQAVR
ncbi:MAG: hypothetical protein JO026_02900, partial [Patescibacteria group bacterium]|nr:hypothetical protein [Patescibacteria group bacterium]